MTEVHELIARCAPWERNDANYAEQEEYLASLLSSEEGGGADDGDRLFETINQFFESSDATRKLISLWESLTLEETDDGKVSYRAASTPPPAPVTLSRLGGGIEQSPKSDDDSDNDDFDLEKQARARKQNTSRARERRKGRKHTKKKPPAQAEFGFGEDVEKSSDLNEVVAKIQDATDQELDDLDDFSSAWRDAREGGRVWGGRGHGGRGVNRGLGKYGGEDAVVNGLTLALGGRDLLLETHLVIARGHRYGLYGKNGVGKSTLLRRVAKGMIPGWPLHLSTKMVEQEVLGSDKTIRECMNDIKNIKHGDCEAKEESINNEIAELENRLAELASKDDAVELEEVSERLADLYDQLEGIEHNMKRMSDRPPDGSLTSSASSFVGIDDAAIELLRGLQFNDSMLDTPVCDLSGGWRMRLALAEALYESPDILLLDEPTNHLDCLGNIFLEDYIKENNITAVIVSHDSHFLDAVCTDIIKFENQKLEYHVGDYSTFIEREKQKWTTNRNILDATARKEKKAKEFINKQKSMSNSKHRDDNKQRQAKEREKKLGRIGLYNEDGKKFKLLSQSKGVRRANHITGSYTNSAGFMSFHVDNSQKAFGEQKQLLNFCFPAADPIKGNVPFITMDSCRFRYDDNQNGKDWLLHDMTMSVAAGSRISILGKNGSGKTSLAKILSGELLPDSQVGAFHRNPNLRVAHISQHHIEQLASFLEFSAVEYLLHHHNAKNDYEARQYLGGFGLIGSLALQPIGTLSGGQKARLAFATVMYTAPHLLVLDEPSNHLDSDSLSSLAKAVEEFKGAVVTVSHNQDFLARISKEVWIISGDGSVQVEVVADADDTSNKFNELFERYKERLRKELRKEQRRCR